MPPSNAQLEERSRLLAMREHLGVRARPEDREFDSEVVAACNEKIRPVVDAHAHCPGEEVIAAVAKHLAIRFEEVRSPADIEALERKYLREQRELGFGRLSAELADPSAVDALLFQRLHAAPDAPDRWVAVINLQETEARAYWSRPHEITHRLAEPPQRRLPFYRHRADNTSRIERIVDLGAAELAFPPTLFRPIVLRLAPNDLTWDVVILAQNRYAPTSSLLSSAKAFLRHWPHPAFLLTAKVQGRRKKPNIDRALRVHIEGMNGAARSLGRLFVENMRVPPTSPISQVHEQHPGHTVTDHDVLDRWSTSDGYRLPKIRALTSSMNVRSRVYALVSIV